MKTLVRMKSTQMGKDDDTALTIKYNEGCECRIGPDLLKAFQALKAVEILKEKESSKKEEKKSDDIDNSTDESPQKSDSSEQEPEKKRGRKKKSK